MESLGFREGPVQLFQDAASKAKDKLTQGNCLGQQKKPDKKKEPILNRDRVAIAIRRSDR